MRLPLAAIFLPPATEVCEGYVFTHVCQSFCSLGGGALQAHTQGEVEGYGWGRGLQGHTQGAGWGVWWGRGLQAYIRGFGGGLAGGISRPTLGVEGAQAHTQGVAQAHTWGILSRSRRGCLQACTEADTPLLECILVMTYFIGPGGGGGMALGPMPGPATANVEED